MSPEDRAEANRDPQAGVPPGVHRLPQAGAMLIVRREESDSVVCSRGPAWSHVALSVGAVSSKGFSPCPGPDTTVLTQPTSPRRKKRRRGWAICAALCIPPLLQTPVGEALNPRVHLSLIPTNLERRRRAA